MNRIKIHRINYYIILSVLIHFFLFLVIEKKNDLTLGEKIIPIEVFDNLLESGVGEAIKRNKRLNERISSNEESQKEKNIKKHLNQIKSFEHNKINKKINYKKVEQNKSKTNNINQTILKKENGSGSKEGIKGNEPEKGTLKGKGTIKVTCLKCVRPIYPPIALIRGSEGKAIIKIWINTNGKVTKADLLTTSGSDSIDNSALKAAINSTFYPLVQNIIIHIEYDMKIK